MHMVLEALLDKVPSLGIRVSRDAMGTLPSSNEHFEIFLGRNPLQSTYWIVQNTLKQLDFLDLFFWCGRLWLSFWCHWEAMPAMPLCVRRTLGLSTSWLCSLLRRRPWANSTSRWETFVFLLLWGVPFSVWINRKLRPNPSLALTFFLSHQVGCGSDLWPSWRWKKTSWHKKASWRCWEATEGDRNRHGKYGDQKCPEI